MNMDIGTHVKEVKERGGAKRLIAGALGIGLATAVGVSAGIAQDDPATPVAGSNTTPAAESPPAPDDFGAAEQEALDAFIERATTELDAVQADRAAADGQTDLANVDALLAQATALRDQAQSAADAADQEQTFVLAAAAVHTAHAAQGLIEAQLSDYSLPSHEARASQTLAAAFAAIDALGTETETDSADTSEAIDTSFYITTAQDLYTAAYDQFQAGQYASAAKTARIAVAVGQTANLLRMEISMGPGRLEIRGDFPGGMRGGPGGERRGRLDHGDGEPWFLPGGGDEGHFAIELPGFGFAIGPDGMGQDIHQFPAPWDQKGNEQTTNEPVTVPEPTF